MKKNLLLSSILFLFSKLSIFFVRRLLNFSLGAKYLGLISIINSTYAVFSFIELSFGALLSIYIYKYINNNRKSEFSFLYHFFRRAYLFLAGLLFFIYTFVSIYSTTLFLDFNDIPFVQIYVFIITISLIIANTLSFVQPFLIAMEKNFIIVFYENIFFLILVFFQYFTFLHTKSILFYFLLQGLITIVPKFLIKTYFNKKFPEILAFDKTIIKSRIQNFNLFKSVQILFPILIIKFVAMVINNIDVIVTASLINLDKLGVYSNYLLIVAIINQLLEQFQKVLMPAFNRFQSNKNGKPYNYFLNLFKFNFYLILFISIFLSLFLNPFLRFWFGGNLILDSTTTTLIIFGFFSSNLRRPFWIFNQINGYYNSFILNSFIELTLLTLFSLILFPIYNLAGLVLGINFSRIISYFYTEINVFVNKKFILHKFKFSLLYIFYISSGALILFSLVQFSTFFSIQISLLLFLFLFSILLLFSFRGLKSLLIYY